MTADLGGESLNRLSIHFFVNRMLNTAAILLNTVMMRPFFPQLLANLFSITPARFCISIQKPTISRPKRNDLRIYRDQWRERARFCSLAKYGGLFFLATKEIRLQREKRRMSSLKSNISETPNLIQISVLSLSN